MSDHYAGAGRVQFRKALHIKTVLMKLILFFLTGDRRMPLHRIMRSA